MMKRVGDIEFTLLPEYRTHPRDLIDFDGYLQGDVYINACPSMPGLVGATVHMKMYNMLSTTPYFVYGAACADQDAQHTLVVGKAAFCEARRLKHGFAWTAHDALHLTQELKRGSHEWSDYIERVMRQVAPRTVGDAVAQLAPTHMARIDVVRLPHASAVYPYVIGSLNPANTEKHVKRKRAFGELGTDKLIALRAMLSTQPWELVWPTPMRTTYKLDPLTPEVYERAMKQYAIAQPPQHVCIALRIYFDMMRQRNVDGKHTLFMRASYNTMFPCVALVERMELVAQVYGYLEAHGVVTLGPSLALATDHNDARRSCSALGAARQRAMELGEPKLRGEHVPVQPPLLTMRQTEVAAHVRSHWFTMVEGLPGTGKTAVITWIFSHYKRTMLCTFVGMMAKSLQSRNGNRREAAYTIDYILTVAKRCPAEAGTWLAWFEVLVVDEFSNVSMKRFAQLIGLFPNLRKIVLVGDHRQLSPIDAGAPMVDLLERYGSLLLVDNLRVMPGLQPLQEAPRLITEGQARHLEFAPNGPLRLVKRSEDICSVLVPIFKAIGAGSLLHTHIVLLLNKTSDGRFAINAAAEAAYTQLGMLVPPRRYGDSVQVRPGLRLYRGCKITVLQNYNKPMEHAFTPKCVVHGDPVANGELFIVRTIEMIGSPASGIRITCVDDEDDPEHNVRTLWIDSKRGIHPKHVDHGYATTTYRTQGREFNNVIFWNRTDPREHWTRPHAYVAISRAKQCCWVVSERHELERVCAQLEPRRRTVFAHLLRDGGNDNANPLPYVPEPMANRDTLVVDAPTPCVKTLKQVVDAMAAADE